jgi:hypothetical protein
LAIWLASVGLTILLPNIAVLIYAVGFDRRTFEALLKGEITTAAGLISIAATFVAQALTLVLCQMLVTDRGRRPFWQTLGWGWHPQFKLVHAAALAILMLAVGAGLEQVLPHRETQLDRLLAISAPVRVAVALLAVLVAPLVEETVYRGILYSGLERARGPVVAVVLVTLLFWGVHVPQYWQSPATLAAMLALSVMLTLLRAATGKLLPCVATHLVFNGIQAAFIVVRPEKAPDPGPTKAAVEWILQLAGLG